MARRGQPERPGHRASPPAVDDESCAPACRESLSAHGGVDADAYDRLAAHLSYVSGDYQDPRTFDAARGARRAVRPVFYLAIPPSLFGVVASSLPDRAWPPTRGWSWRSRSAATSRRRARSTPPCTSRFPRRRSIASTTSSARSRCRTCCTSALPTRSSSRSGTLDTSPACRSRWPRRSACADAASSTKRSAPFATSFQNHLLQVLALWRWTPPSANDGRRHRGREGGVSSGPSGRSRRRTSCAASIAATAAEAGVAPDSRVETYVAARLAVDNARWAGVPMLDSRRQVPGGDGHRGAGHASSRRPARSSTRPRGRRTNCAFA